MVQLNDSDWANLTIPPTGSNWPLSWLAGSFHRSRYKNHLFVALFEGYSTSWIPKKSFETIKSFFHRGSICSPNSFPYVIFRLCFYLRSWSKNVRQCTWNGVVFLASPFEIPLDINVPSWLGFQDGVGVSQGSSGTIRSLSPPHLVAWFSGFLGKYTVAYLGKKRFPATSMKKTPRKMHHPCFQNVQSNHITHQSKTFPGLTNGAPSCGALSPKKDGFGLAGAMGSGDLWLDWTH